MSSNTILQGPDYQFLKNVPILEGVSEESLKRLFAGLEKGRFQAGDYIFRQDELVDRLYIMEMGKAEIFKSDINGRKLTLWFIESGGVFCLANMFAHRSFANALAQTDCLLYSISKTKLTGILAEDRDLTQRLIGCMSRKVVAYSSLLEDLTFKNVPARLAGLLLRCIGLTCSTQAECRITQAEMASLLGTSREVVSRILKRFREDGLIDFVKAGKARHVRVMDENRLKYISREEDD